MIVGDLKSEKTDRCLNEAPPENGETRSVLFVRPTMGSGGADRVTLNILKNLDRAKFKAELALMRAEGVFLNELPTDIPVHDCRTFSLWWLVRPLMRLILDNSYDLVYCTCGGASIPATIAVLFSRKPVCLVVSERNILFHPGKNRIKRWFMLFLKRWLYRRANWVTAVSEGVRQEIIRDLKVPPDKVVVVNNPIVDNTIVDQSQSPLGIPCFDGMHPVILAVGRMVHQKNYLMLLDAFQIVSQRTSANLMILGDGPLRQKIEARVNELQLNSRVLFSGFDKDPFKYMARCDVFALSSDHEGMPGVLIQALACGAPCVSTDCPTGPNELIRDGENGFLVPVGDSKAMADRILRLLNDPDLSRKFRDAGPKSVERFRTEQAIQSYFSFLETGFSSSESRNQSIKTNP